MPPYPGATKKGQCTYLSVQHAQFDDVNNYLLPQEFGESHINFLLLENKILLPVGISDIVPIICLSLAIGSKYTYFRFDASSLLLALMSP